MTIQTISDARDLIRTRDSFSTNDSFDLSRICSTFLKDREKEHWGREIAIRVLEHQSKFPNETKPLWNDIVEMSGLYPYVKPETLSGGPLIRYEYHKSKHLSDVYFHEEQEEVSQQLQSGNSVILSAPTSFGKSLLIEELIASKKYANIVIIQPTLALLDETRKKLQKYKNSYNVIVSTSQTPREELRNIFLFTGERVVEYTQFPQIDFFVIDEFYKLSLDRDDDRAVTLNLAFHKLLQRTSKFYLLGPVIKSIPISFQKKLNIGIRYTNFSTVAIDEIPVFSTRKKTKDEKQTRLFELLTSMTEPTLIYCSAPEKATKLADAFSSFYKTDKDYGSQNKDMIEWIDENIGSKWTLIKCLKKGVSFHCGILPRHLGSSIVDSFNAGSIKYLFCTSTLIEGVNTTAKNIILFDNTKGTIPIDFFDYKNIAGRSGRMRVYYTGRIYKFHDTPPQLELDVDIPFVTQSNAPDELLFQLDNDELSSESKERLKQYENLDTELAALIRSNSGVTIEGQLAVISEIENNLRRLNSAIAWSGFPTYQQLAPVTELIWKHLMRPRESKANVVSPAQLATYTIQYSVIKTIKGVIDNQINNPYWLKTEPDEQQRINRVTFNMLNAMRHWFEYKLPKLLTTISKLQEYAFKKHNMKAGDYTAFANAIENGFVQSELTTLLEYDVPMSAISKISQNFQKDDSFERILDKLKKMDLAKTKLNNYEKKKINQIF